MAGASQTFTASFAGAGNPGVTWAVDGIPNGDSRVGTVNASGASITYKAPATLGSHLLSATITASPSRAAYAAVTIRDACVPAPVSKPTLNVKDPAYGAKGDGVADDTGAIQNALNAAAGTGGTVRVPAGTYLVNPIAHNGRGLILGSRLTFDLAPGAVLKAIPNAAENYTIVSVSFANDVKIQGGTLMGDRDRHRGTTGEWGMGLSIESSRNVVVADLTARECWGDGFYVYGSKNVTLCAVLAQHNRRNGASIVECDGLTVRSSVFRDTQGTAPEDGLDIEPNPGQTVSNVLITGCLFAENAGSGLESGVPDSNIGRAFIANVAIDGNTFTSNGKAPVDGTVKMAINISNSPGHRVINNIILNNKGQGIYLRFNADDSLISGNIIARTEGDGIVQAACKGNRITGNQILRNSGHGIMSTNCFGGSVSGNTLTGNGLSP
jgi:parallel beta-helix repeat protein